MISNASVLCSYFNPFTMVYQTDGMEYETLTNTHLICKSKHMSHFTPLFTPIVNQDNSTTPTNSSNVGSVNPNESTTTNYLLEFPLKPSGIYVVLLFLFIFLTGISTNLYKDKKYRFKLNSEFILLDLKQP